MQPLNERMNDPHVDALVYEYHTVPGIKFADSKAVTFETGVFRLRLENSVLTVELLAHFPTIADAREGIEEFLKAWEISASVDHGSPVHTFEFAYADITDRRPTTDKKKTIRRLEGKVRFHVAVSDGSETVLPQVPSPPSMYASIREVDAMWKRYWRCVNDKEPVASMAYFCLTLAEKIAGGRSGAVQLFGINKDVLSTLGRLTSTSGDLETARKIVDVGTRKPHTTQELTWMKAATRELIRRVGRFETIQRAKPLILSMSDLPPLP